jgi:hypothetical protein
MSKAAKRKLQPTDDTAMTTEHLAGEFRRERKASQLKRGAVMADETYKQTLHLGDRTEVEADDCFNLAQVIFARDDTGTMRIAASVGNGPLYVKFMKSEEAA